jgi:hypothetical protein
MWATCFLSNNGSHVPTNVHHVIPLRDSLTHFLRPDCFCDPAIIPVEAEGNIVITYAYFHRAADGRKE